jgi:hypothetical protein
MNTTAREQRTFVVMMGGGCKIKIKGCDRVAVNEGGIEVIRAYADNDHRVCAVFPVNSVHGVYPEEDTEVVE